MTAYALIQDNGEVAKIISEDRVEWGGAFHSCLSLMTPAERRRFKVYDVVDLERIGPADTLANGETLLVDAVAGVVTRIFLWRSLSQAEITARAKVQAAADLASSDAGTIRVVEDLVDALIAKGVIVKNDLPTAARKKLDDRKALRAAIA